MSSNIKSHFGRLRFGDLGVDLEVMGAVQTLTPDGTWTPPTDPAQHRRLVNLDDAQVPVLSLSYEADAYARLGRADRAEHLPAIAGPVGGCTIRLSRWRCG
ncbi:MAG: nucleotidyltransferase domain-containing protein [Acidimicrobiia bacterium]